MYARPGHIPTAKNVSVMSLLDDRGGFAAGRIGRVTDNDVEARIITYCGGGIAASSTAFVVGTARLLRHRGLHGSLQEWAADPANPLEVETAAE